ncbi:DinB family protein [Streptomyces sodiiphilus]|uniref:DinB family protein n=1 Tax=Streptomyces sodiiphilus TaxID=226217 RepID=A0ABN2PAH0_9ACTN
MNPTRSELLRWQFDLTWSLFEYHLERLEPHDFLWEPVPHCWTVRPDAEGRWLPDWADTEPEPVPVPTIGWISWHLGWWWSVATDHAQRRTPRERTDVAWPGEGGPAIAWLRGLRDEWLTVLTGLTDSDLDFTAPFPWPHDSAYTVAHMAAWVNSELMKNATEIGQLRLLRAASRESRA